MLYRYKTQSDVMVSVVYKLLEPKVLQIQRPDGRIDSVSYGIGDIITVWEPQVITLEAPNKYLEKIPLTNGSYIVNCPKDIRIERQTSINVPTL